MNKAMARHTLVSAGWTPPQIEMATRVLRHNASRRNPAVVPVLSAFAEQIEPGAERQTWHTLVERLDDTAQVEALKALLAL